MVKVLCPHTLLWVILVLIPQYITKFQRKLYNFHIQRALLTSQKDQKDKSISEFEFFVKYLWLLIYLCCHPCIFIYNCLRRNYLNWKPIAAVSKVWCIMVKIYLLYVLVYSVIHGIFNSTKKLIIFVGTEINQRP